MSRAAPVILVAPDSFKGSLSASRFCEIAERVLGAQLPQVEIATRPMADGGEGTVEAVLQGAGGTPYRTRVTGPLGEPVEALWGMLPDGRTAVIEMAAASGLPLVADEARDPLRASSFGTGELIRAALDAGAQRIILGLGGSATNDGGAGALQALGLRLLDADGRPLPTGAGALEKLAAIDASGLDPRLARTEVILASDVTNPLLGPKGATAVYGPQKGVDEQTGPRLEAGLARFAEITARLTGVDHRETAGAGAAGGMGFGMLSWLGAALRSGFEVVADLVGLPEVFESGRLCLVVTGEGAINDQSAQGKLVGRIAQMSQAYGVAVVALAGALQPGCEALYGLGVVSMQSIVPRPMTLEQAMRDSEELLAARLRDLAGIVKLTSSCAWP